MGDFANSVHGADELYEKASVTVEAELTPKIVEQEVWRGSIVLKITLNEADTTSAIRPEPVMLLASRMSYLPVAVSAVVNEFRRSAIEFSSNIWFSSNKRSLKSHLPIGVLYDSEMGERRENLTPWDITVHFQHFPAGEVVPCDRLADSEKLFFHSLKQALHLLHGNTRLYNEFTISSQQHLWQSLCTADCDEYTNSIAPLLPNDAHHIVRLPVRLIYCGSASSTHQNSRCMQRPVSFLSKDECSLRTLYEVLIEDFSPYANEVKVRLESGRTTCRTVVIHGIDVPIDAPAVDVWQLLHHCDLFLYMILV